MLASRLTGRGAQREEVVTLGFDVLVEQHLFAGDLGVLVELPAASSRRDRLTGQRQCTPYCLPSKLRP